MVTDEEKFRNVFMQRACEKYNYLNHNRGKDSLEFTLDDFATLQNRENPEKGGFDMENFWGKRFIEDEILPFLENQGLIERMSFGVYRLTGRGKRHCKENKLY